MCARCNMTVVNGLYRADGFAENHPWSENMKIEACTARIWLGVATVVAFVAFAD